MQFKYSLNEWPPAKQTVAFGFQWLMLTVPLIIILGKVIATVQYPQDTALQLTYLQKLFFCSGLVFTLQLLIGHRLPIITGPASVLLVGILANATIAREEDIYTSIMAGGAVVAMLAATGRLSGISRWFTKRIIGVVLLLIAFTMLPTILKLVAGGTSISFGKLAFAGVMLAAMLAGQRFLPEFIRSTMLVWALIVGGSAYELLFSTTIRWSANGPVSWSWPWLIQLPPSLMPDLGVLLSFLFCFLALIANDIGSIQTTAQLVEVPDRDKRTRSGLLITGAGNVLAGFLGVIGPVSFSLSAGIILSSRCASRYTLLPASAGMIALSFTPRIIEAFAVIPSPVIGMLLLYMMCSQIAGGLGLLKDSFANYTFETGIVVGAPLLVATLIAFLPGPVVAAIPVLVRPVLANGFVMGVLLTLFLEHLVYNQARLLADNK